MAIVGIFSNLGTMITLSVNGEDFSHVIRMLFQYQSAVDCVCSLQVGALITFIVSSDQSAVHCVCSLLIIC